MASRWPAAALLLAVLLSAAEALQVEPWLRARGVATIYRDPYWFLPTRVGGGWQKLPEWRATTTDSAAA